MYNRMLNAPESMFIVVEEYETTRIICFAMFASESSSAPHFRYIHKIER